MKINCIAQISLLVASALVLSSCSILEGNRAKKEAATAEERAGRIDMVLGDEEVTADPALATTPITLPEAIIVDRWGQAGGVSSKTTGHLAAAAEFKIAWRTNAGEGSSKKSALIATPVSDGETIYVIDADQDIRAFDAATGSRKWQAELDSGRRRDNTGIGAGIAVEDGTLVVASGFGFVAALDAASGTELWRTVTEAPMTGSPTIKDGRVFVSSNNNEVYALELTNGQIIWSDQAIAESARVLGSPSPAAVEDIVVAPYSSGEIIAYLASNGRRLWDEALASPGQFTPISSINDIGARPVLSGGLVFAASQSGVMAAIDGRTGTRIWQQPLGSIQAPALVGPYIFMVSTEAQLVCINAGTGQVFWVQELKRFKDEKKKKGRVTYSGPVVASGRVVLASSLGELLAFDPQTGEAMDSLKLGDPVFIEPIAVQDKLILLTDDARLIAVR